MKKFLTIAGLILHIIYYIFAILSLGDYEYVGYGVGKAFAFWIYAMITSLICIVIYFIDSIWSIKINRKIYNILKLTLILFAVPLCVFVGCSVGAVNSIIWNIYFAIIFVIQIISLFINNEYHNFTLTPPHCRYSIIQTGGNFMKIFDCFKLSKQLIQETEFVKIYKCISNEKEYKIIMTKKSANKYTIIHCTDDNIVWEQFSALFNWGGKTPYKRTPIYKFSQNQNSVIIFVISGKPNGIIGLDDGIFRCANNFDDDYINVMSYDRFKKL